MTERARDFSWVKKKYGIEFSSLDDDIQKAIKELGEEGVEELVDVASKGLEYRGTRLTQDERINLLENISRLIDFDEGGNWANGEPSIKGDKPQDWIEREVKDLSVD